MCIHIAEALTKEVKFWRRKGLANVSGIQLMSDSGRFLGSWLCFADQPESIAQAVKALHTWHPGSGNWIDFALVNLWRRSHKLPAILQESALPPPPALFTVEAMPDDDTPAHTRAMVKRWLDSARDATYGRA